MKVKVLELWCGTKSSTQPWKDHGDEVVSVDFNAKFNPTIRADIIDITTEQLLERGPYDFGWASPECKVYSIANLHSRHWKKDEKTDLAIPLTQEAKDMNERVIHTIKLLSETCPLWALENPMGMLRKQPFMQELQRVTITYCQYGDFRMKKTDLWGVFPATWNPLPPCSPGASCHEPSPRGKNTGTQSLTWEDRIKVPYPLAKSLRQAVIDSEGQPTPTLELWTV